MTAGIEIGRYHGDHLEQVLQLQHHLWGGDPVLNRAYFTWKYLDNPYLSGPAIVLALHRGNVVGMRGIVGARWQVGASGDTLAIPFTDDLVLAPEYRGKGVSAQLVRAACGYARDLGYASVLSLRGGHLTMLDSLAAGFQVIGALEPVGRWSRQAAFIQQGRQFLRGARLLWRLSDVSLPPPASDRHPYRRLERRCRAGAGQAGGVRVERMALPAAMAELVERLPGDDRIRHVQDHEYFDWVFRNPRLEYRFLYWMADRLEGYLVLHRELPQRKGPVTVWIADWQGTSDAVRADLLRAAVRGGRFTRLATWTATLSDGARLMLGQGGVEPIDLEARARGGPAALIWPAHEGALEPGGQFEGRRLTDLRNWTFRLLDQD